MQKNLIFPASLLVSAFCVFCLSSLAACDPKYNWREIPGKDAPFTVLLPAKPANLARPVNLAGHTYTMSMTAAEVGHVSFAVGSVLCPDAKEAHEALNAMQTAMVNNINGKVKSLPSSGGAVDIEAVGSAQPGGEPLLLVAHFVVSGNRAWQVIVLGPEKEVEREQVTTFISSFKPG
jgi:hypothetical protein